MTFWIQHGFGKASKIETVARTGLLSGVVLSPADEELATLTSTARMIHGLGVSSLLDPQLYVHTISGGVARCHESNGLDFGEISWFVSPGEIADHVSEVVATNQHLSMEEIIAPTPYQVSFGDVWTPLSLQYARATISEADRPVYVSLVAEDSAFSDWEQTQRYMDALTRLDATGIYLIVGTSGRTYPLQWEPERLANILRVIHTLSVYNEYDVLWGYSDIAGLLGVAVGATGAATGWYHSLRMWTTGKWVPQSGGRQANPRILVQSLLSAIGRTDEAIGIARSREGARVFPDSDERRGLVREDTWGIADSWDQHLDAMARLHQSLDEDADVSERVVDVQQRLDSAVELIDDLTGAGVYMDAAHRRRLLALTEAVQRFVADEDL
ncbi:MAG: hypothetical protein F4Z00_10070 [Acidimicrobiaceae bacterium]|nr:hypothetical protein [Acidimicrobiaceae bacterium]MXZ65882.1 hypothetical protein [Acidimicrobiaceae bacterium]MYF32108.1 hypothetical protein [Acidimicrobiaceae bacterium]MYJ30967.1 hypothetical protein [Acidimicrobiaceae bacterium]MYJ85068.1 hypothetical protein [Acidimicrobiaceae bacterium]